MDSDNSKDGHDLLTTDSKDNNREKSLSIPLAEWENLVNNDLRAANSLLRDKNLLLSAFHLQQAVEKCLKLYFLWTKKTQPAYIHNLTQLALNCGLEDDLNESQRNLLDLLNPYYIKARYPTYKKKVAENLSFDLVQTSCFSAEEFIKWLKAKMK